jgi:hypothetical protein
LINSIPSPAQSIGICGAHRTGKTTLALKLAEILAIPFVRTSVSQVFRERGLDPAQTMDFATRLSIQNDILTATTDIWAGTAGKFISDRTPIDMMAYTLADIQGMTTVDADELSRYLYRCQEITNQYFSQLWIIPPAIPLIFEDGKAALNPAYIQHIHHLVMGLCHDPAIRSTVIPLPPSITALDDRVRFFTDFLLGKLCFGRLSSSRNFNLNES